MPFFFLGVESLTVFVNTCTFLSGFPQVLLCSTECFSKYLRAYLTCSFSLFSSSSLPHFSFAFFSFPFPWLSKLQAELLSSVNYLFSFVLNAARQDCPLRDRKVLSMTKIMKSSLCDKSVCLQHFCFFASSSSTLQLLSLSALRPSKKKDVSCPRRFIF